VSATAFFDAEAARYDAWYESNDWAGRFLRARLAAALEAVGDGPGRVLDAGMGGGRLVAELAARGWTVSGVDSSTAMVELARRRLPQLADRLLAADMSALPFADGSFDAVTATAPAARRSSAFPTTGRRMPSGDDSSSIRRHASPSGCCRSRGRRRCVRCIPSRRTGSKRRSPLRGSTS
jgi:SAM-dependent methyltransferase